MVRPNGPTEVSIFFLAFFVGLVAKLSRGHGSYKGRHPVQLFATGLPDLSKPSRDLLQLRKTKFFRNKRLKHFEKLTSIDFCRVSSFLLVVCLLA